MHGITTKTATSLDALERPLTAFLEAQGFNSLFLQPFWLRFIESLGFEPAHFIASRNGQICGFMPSFILKKGSFRQLSSLPRGGGGMCLGRNPEAVFQAIMAACGGHCKARHVHTRRLSLTDPQMTGQIGLLREAGFRLAHVNCRLVLPIMPTLDEQLALCGASRRNEVRQSLKRGAQLERPEPEDFLREFYPLYQQAMKGHGAAVQPLHSLETLFAAANGQVQGLLAKVDGQLAAGVVVLLNARGKSMHYYLSAMDRSFSWQRPIERLLFACLEQGAEMGMTAFDMMGTEADFRSGLYHYKKEWGAEPRPNIYMEDASPLYRLARACRKWLKKGRA